MFKWFKRKKATVSPFDHVIRMGLVGYMLGYPDPKSWVICGTCAIEKFVESGATAFTRDGAIRLASALNTRCDAPGQYEAVHVSNMRDGEFWSDTHSSLEQELETLKAFEGHWRSTGPVVDI